MQIYNCEHCNNKTQCTVMRVETQILSKFVEIQNLSKKKFVEMQNSVKICRNSKFVEIQNSSKFKVLSEIQDFSFNFEK